LRHYMPITWITSLIGSLALIGTPFFSGFYSKDSIIAAVSLSDTPGAGIAYVAVLLGVFVTAFYSFRMYFMVFHGETRMDEHIRAHAHETPWVVTVPLIMLAIPSVVIGYMTVGPVLFEGYFHSAIHVFPEHDVMGHLAEEFHSPFAFGLHGFLTPAFWLALAGVVTAWYIYLKRPELAAELRRRFTVIYDILDRKYGFDEFNQKVFAAGSRCLGSGLWKYGDAGVIDGLLVNGTARTIGWFAARFRHIQSGYLYHYAFAMIIDLLVLLTWAIAR